MNRPRLHATFSALLVVWACVASCAKGRVAGNGSSSSAVASSAPAASPAAKVEASASADPGVVSAPLPEELLGSIVGCWRLDDQEQWTISRTEQGGARVTRRVLTAAANSEFARRAATPSRVMYDPKQRTFAFSTAGPRHAALFVFKAGPAGLTGSWASSRAPGEGYHLTGSNSTLRRCSGSTEGVGEGTK